MNGAKLDVVPSLVGEWLDLEAGWPPSVGLRDSERRALSFYFQLPAGWQYRRGLDTFAEFLAVLCNNGGDFPGDGVYSVAIPCDAPCTSCARLFGRLEASW